ncbi:MAG: glycosyltransferase family 2 protein [Kiritimatiellae bacterium]|nr:glycosyltransferase family 2 protein [Kiritimatiellia bacterium]MDD5521721.1 glycosyltransferase family 2 protein [Kiritimatiellia bacterium]
MDSRTDGIDLSFVFPCLNEEETLGSCLNELHAALNGSRLSYEIIVADNGSSDSSPAIAKSAGALVVPVTVRGYGAALRGGFAAAKGKYIAFADADGSYPVGDIVKLYETAEASGADIVIASRLKGNIEPGAMPFLHRRLGTPLLTALINVLYGGKLSDCNSGFRIVKKSAYDTWNIRSNGMEFASEILIKALKSRVKILEIQSGLRRDRRSKPPHLKTWSDGMRHLLFILSEKPALFESLGLSICGLVTALQVAAYFSGPVKICGATVFDTHSKIILLALAGIGMQMYLFACHLYVASDEPVTQLTHWIIEMDEAQVFLNLIFLLLLEIIGLVSLFLYWGGRGFSGLYISDLLILLTHLLLLGGFAGFGVLGIHILKKRMK